MRKGKGSGNSGCGIISADIPTYLEELRKTTGNLRFQPGFELTPSKCEFRAL
jgi:hypothetical protein